MSFTRQEVDRVWDKAKKIRGENPDETRQDPYKNPIKRSNYGKNTATGWEIDHIKPKIDGGSDHTINLQALQTKKNRELGDTKMKRSRHNQR